MNWVDYTIVAIIIISALISLARGFMTEALSLVGWILAFWVAIKYTQPFSTFLVDTVTIPALRHGLAFFALFVATLLVVALVNFLIGQLVDKTGLTGTDRMLGMVFGIARGVVVIAVLVLLAGLTAFPEQPWWRASVLIEHFQVVAVEIRKWLPPDIANYVSY